MRFIAGNIFFQHNIKMMNCILIALRFQQRLRQSDFMLRV